MTFRTWEEVVRTLESVTGPATEKQVRLGEFANKKIDKNTPRIVAASILKNSLSQELDIPSLPVTERNKFILDLLCKTEKLGAYPESDDEAIAWITYLRLVQRKEQLKKLKITEGDIVQKNSGEYASVSSISDNGKIFFKGGKGFSAWPDLVTVIARTDDRSSDAELSRKKANNAASLHSSSATWSIARQEDLRDYAINDIVKEHEIDEFESIVESAKDEKVIQEFLEENKHFLTSLLGGKERYCLPQKRLGSEYIPDFIIGDVDSLGIRWTLVEIETPNSGIYLKNGTELDEKARKGVNQIIEWRSWLADNIAYARNPKSQNGLCLFDIREKARALVIVGRRSRNRSIKDAVRHEYRQSSNIEIHSYDWLIEQLRGAIHFQGPPAFNPFLIQ